MIGHRQIVIDGDNAAESLTRRTGADRIIEAEQGGNRFAIFNIAIGAMKSIGESPSQFCLIRRVQFINSEASFAEMIRLFARLGEPGAGLGRKLQSILDDSEAAAVRLCERTARLLDSQRLA